MYNTDPDKAPKRPIVTSLVGALSEIRKWQQDNQLGAVHDADGMTWELAVKVTSLPDPHTAKSLLWQVRMGLSVRASAEEFVADGTLARPADARLLDLIGAERVEISMKPVIYTVTSEDEARQVIGTELPRLKANFAGRALREVKRTLIGRWINARCLFGGRSG